MKKVTTCLSIFLAVGLVSGSALAQGGEDSEMVGSAPGEEADESSESETSEQDEQSRSEDSSNREESEKEKSESEATAESGMQSAEDGADAEASESTGSMDSMQETDTGDDSTASGGHPSVENNFVIAPHVGGTFPAFSDLGLWGMFGLELGYQPPIDGRPLEIAVIGRYSQPGAEGSSSDPNLGESGADYSWNLTQRMIVLDLVGIYRFRGVSEKLHPYGMAGPRLNLMRSEITAQGNGADFGKTEETNSEFGFVVGGGVDYRLGPGTLFSELKFGWTNLDQTLTGNSNTGSFVLDLGYRFFPF